MENLNTKEMWGQMLETALTQPGVLSDAYSLFHSYSIANGILAMLQLGDKAGPIATYKKWAELGRQVKKGEKAIALYMPVSVGGYKPKKDEAEEAPSEPTEKGGKTVVKVGGKEKKPRTAKVGGKMAFVLRRNWFSLAQTEGEQEPTFDAVPVWKVKTALDWLGITREAFSHADGNCMGYAYVNKKVLAVSPLAPYPYKTLFHEIAHLLLHSKDAEFRSEHGGKIPYNVAEVEAESVAYIVCATLGIEKASQESSRAYIQGWMRNEAQRKEFHAKHAQRVFGAAQRILAAGKQVAQAEVEQSTNAAQAA